jgi:hypothetical protein
MSQLTPLEYGGYEKPRKLSKRAILALMAGICVGPVATIASVFVVMILPDPIQLKYGGHFIAGVSGAFYLCVLLLCMRVSRRLKAADGPRGRGLAVGGIVATAIWMALTTLFLLIAAP